MKQIAFFILGLACGLLFTLPVHTDDPTIKVVKEYEPIVRYKYKQEIVFNDPEMLKMCYSSVIQSELTFGKGFVEVDSQDACKQSIQRFDIEVAQTGGWKFYLGAGIVAGAGAVLVASKILN